MMKPLDFVRTKNGSIGMITQVSMNTGPDGVYLEAAIDFLHECRNPNVPREKHAWWDGEEFDIIDNLPDLLARTLNPEYHSDSFQPFKLNKESKL